MLQDAGLYSFRFADGSTAEARYSFIYVLEDGEWKISITIHLCNRLMQPDTSSSSPTTVSSVVTFLMHGLIKAYQRLISPLLGPNCRFTPTCSQYAIEAIEIHGPSEVVGWQFVVSRCHPFHPGGFDPVPPKAQASASKA